MAKDYKCHGEMTRRGEFLRWNVNSAFGGLVGPRTVWRWVGSARLTELGVAPWMGPGSIPLWLPPEEYGGMLAHDPAPAADAGLVVRPLSETAADTLAWWHAEDGHVTGLTPAEESEVLARA